MALNDKSPQTGKNKSFSQSLQHAAIGFVTAFHEEKNMQSHLICLFLVVILGFVCRISRIEFIIIIIVSFMVITLEIINTSFENLVDLITKGKFDPLAKKVKDMAAAAVLVVAILAFIVGLAIFIPRFIVIFQQLIGG